MGEATWGRKRMELIYNIMEEIDYGQSLRSNLRQIKMQTGQQVRKHVRNLLKTAGD